MFTKNTTIGNVVAQNIAYAHVFKKYNLDFCCGGGKTITEACAKAGVDADNLIIELQKTLNTEISATHDFTTWSMTLLSNYIEEKHHSYVKEKGPILLQYANKVALVHGKAHTYLQEMNKLVQALIADLASHLMKEEQILFPELRKMEKEKTVNVMVIEPIKQMLREHDNVGEILRDLAGITNHYDAPEYACNTWKAYYNLLASFEDDLMTHIHLENNILFKKAEEML